MLCFSALYWAAGAVKDIKAVIAALPLAALVLSGVIAHEDGKSNQAEALVQFAKIQNGSASAQQAERPLA